MFLVPIIELRFLRFRGFHLALGLSHNLSLPTMAHMQKYFILWILFLFCFSAFAKTRLMSCSAKDLELKSCTISRSGLRVGLSEEKIRFTHGPWTSIDSFPGFELVTHWQEVKLVSLEGRQLISLKVWKKIEKEVVLEELHWILLEPIKTKLHLLLDHPVGKRKLVKEGPAPLIQDQMPQTKLWLKNGKVHWQAGKKSGVLQDGL